MMRDRMFTAARKRLVPLAALALATTGLCGCVAYSQPPAAYSYYSYPAGYYTTYSYSPAYAGPYGFMPGTDLANHSASPGGGGRG